ncbi:DUF6302 family protein [Streptomyces microflavus]|uniref:DUF6302 family protein n=1 Tax=Streptomyces TaxID=1883 RepID=UPI00117E250B|nr:MULTISPECIES: DUF6302 family protein [Streptomyces]WSR89082.1 DUF6302 family protein [Streptomyces microflavus]
MFHNPEADDHPAVVATVLAPGTACDYSFFEQRLVDRSLLGLSVAVRTLRLAWLAVPVGESRRGGFYTVSCSCFALAVREALAELDGFPNVRLREATAPAREHLVEWGGPSPMLDPSCDAAVVNEFFGFRPSADRSLPAAHCGH